MKTLKFRNGIKLVFNLVKKVYEVIKNNTVVFRSNNKNKAFNSFYNVARHSNFESQYFYSVG